MAVQCEDSKNHRLRGSLNDFSVFALSRESRRKKTVRARYHDLKSVDLGKKNNNKTRTPNERSKKN